MKVASGGKRFPDLRILGHYCILEQIVAKEAELRACTFNACREPRQSRHLSQRRYICRRPLSASLRQLRRRRRFRLLSRPLSSDLSFRALLDEPTADRPAADCCLSPTGQKKSPEQRARRIRFWVFSCGAICVGAIRAERYRSGGSKPPTGRSARRNVR